MRELIRMVRFPAPLSLLGLSALALLCAVALVVPTAGSASAGSPQRASVATQTATASSCGRGRVKRWGRCVPKAQIFHPNRHNLTGLSAARTLLPFLKNSTFTDCRARFPRCAVENRYGHFSSGLMYYCRLTPSSGADIINGGRSFQIIGATVSKNGSWAVTLRVLSYGGAFVYYTWAVTNTGTARGLYWGPGFSPTTSAANQRLGPLLSLIHI